MKCVVNDGTRRKVNVTVAVLGLIGLFLSLTGCVSGPAAVAGSQTDASGKPDWVTQGSASLKTRTGRLFHGVGVAGKKGSLSQQTLTADNRARTELARVIAAYIEIGARNYIASGKADESRFTQQVVNQLVDKYTHLNMADVQIADHWRDPQSERVYSVAELDMAHIKASLEQAGNAHRGFTHYLKSQAEVIFDGIARRIE